MATQPMLKFVKIGRDMPVKRGAESRTGDFREIYAEYADQKAREQSSRCSQCGVPYCQTHCPLHNNIPDWLRLTAEGRLREAYEVSQATNTFPEICGRICPQDRLCEGNCVIEQSGHGTVTIGAVEKYITDTAWEEGWVAADPPGMPSGAKAWASSARAPAGWRRRTCCAAPACRSRSMTATTARAG
jgi:glutamate synthase (NADPH/NADH) small chain